LGPFFLSAIEAFTRALSLESTISTDLGAFVLRGLLMSLELSLFLFDPVSPLSLYSWPSSSASGL
jgi:hypothetical protein